MGWGKHPNPQFKRTKWMTLNGEWLMNGLRILVPFCPEAPASKCNEVPSYNEKDYLVYEKSFRMEEYMYEGVSKRFLLHLDGVDQHYAATLNGNIIGGHIDGYTKGVFDITDLLNRDEDNLLKVIAVDSVSEDLPYGKQKIKRGGMWYTPFSGIWKSVWIEAVPDVYLRKVGILADCDKVNFKFNFNKNKDSEVNIRIFPPALKNRGESGKGIEDADGEEEYWNVLCVLSDECEENGVDVDLKTLVSNQGNPFDIRLWNTDEPWIYDIEIESGEDRVYSYFALRTVSVEDINGIPRVCLNGKPIFLHGVLDQGYYDETLVLPFEEEEYERDILRMKQLGFNMLRKHIKVESDWFYYYCDINGMLVMQDMVNSGKYRYIIDTVLPTFGIKLSNDRFRKTGILRRQNFERHVREVVSELISHPSIISYTIFNEGWGQHISGYYYDLVKGLDPSRLIDSASGWFTPGKTDFDSRHIYFKLREIKPLKKYKNKPIFITECGGYSYAVKEHLYNKNASYGYGACDSVESLTDRIEMLYNKMIIPGIRVGVCGCIYTQLSDVEDEINGLYTYDREVCKADEKRMRALSDKLRGGI